jgi:DNA-binding NarL/FixJ family response regulator
MSYISEVMDRFVQELKPVMVKVGIVDDSKATVASLCEVFGYSKKIKVVLTAKTGDELLEKLKRMEAAELPDIMITDVNMPGMNGIEVVRRGKALYPDIRFIMLTVFDDEETLFEAIQAGASGYLLKDERSSIILAHLEHLMEDGSAPMSPRIARKTLDMLAHSSKAVTGSEIIELEGLSAREKDVLYLLVDGLEYKEIAVRLNISPHTVRTHIANVYEKLHISSKAQAIRLMQGNKTRTEPIGQAKMQMLLVDDHEIILDSLSMMISTLPDFEVTGKISDPTKVMEFLATHDIDIIVSDINMPKLDGLSLLALVKAKHPGVKVLMLTVSEGEEHVRKALALGVEGYVSKKANKDELTRALRAIMAGGRYFGNGIASWL